MDEDVAYWFQLARLDLESARKSLQGDSFLHCLFGCQQALEKSFLRLGSSKLPSNRRRGYII